MPFGDTDLDAFMADSPYTLTAGNVTAPCWFASSDEVLLMARGVTAGQMTSVPVAQVLTRDFPAIKSGDACTVAENDPNTGEQVSATQFTVFRPPERIQDGSMTELLLKAV